MLIGVSFASDTLELQMHRRNFQPACKRADDLILFFLRAQHKVDGDNFDHLDKAMVFGIDNAVLHFLNGQIIRHWIEAGGLLLLDTGGAFGQAFLFMALFCVLFCFFV